MDLERGLLGFIGGAATGALDYNAKEQAKISQRLKESAIMKREQAMAKLRSKLSQEGATHQGTIDTARDKARNVLDIAKDDNQSENAKAEANNRSTNNQAEATHKGQIKATTTAAANKADKEAKREENEALGLALMNSGLLSEATMAQIKSGAISQEDIPKVYALMQNEKKSLVNQTDNETGEVTQVRPGVGVKLNTGTKKPEALKPTTKNAMQKGAADHWKQTYGDKLTSKVKFKTIEEAAVAANDMNYYFEDSDIPKYIPKKVGNKFIISQTRKKTAKDFDLPSPKKATGDGLLSASPRDVGM